MKEVSFRDLNEATQFIILFALVVGISTFIWVIHLSNQIGDTKNIAHKYCENETQQIEELIWVQTECPSFKEFGYLMYCANSNGTRLVNKTIEVCEIR